MIPSNEKTETDNSYIDKILLTISILQKRIGRKRDKNPFSPQLVLSAKFLSYSHLTVHHRMHFVSVCRQSVTERQPVTSTILLSMSGQWLVCHHQEEKCKAIPTLLECWFLNEVQMKKRDLNHIFNALK